MDIVYWVYMSVRFVFIFVFIITLCSVFVVSFSVMTLTDAQSSVDCAKKASWVTYVPMRLGHRNPRVLCLQKYLNKLGYRVARSHIRETSTVTVGTLAALSRFQQGRGITDTGYLDPNTLQEIRRTHNLEAPGRINAEVRNSADYPNHNVVAIGWANPQVRDHLGKVVNADVGHYILETYDDGNCSGTPKKEAITESTLLSAKPLTSIIILHPVLYPIPRAAEPQQKSYRVYGVSNNRAGKKNSCFSLTLPKYTATATTTQDTTPPILTLVSQNPPAFTIKTSEAGTLADDCTTAPAARVSAGDIDLNFTSLRDGIHTCTISVTDAVGNRASLTLPTFTKGDTADTDCTTNTPACTFFNKHIGVFRRSDMHEHFPKVLRDVFDDKDLRESWHPIAVESYLDSPFGLSGLLRDEDTAETKESLKIFMGLLSAKDDVRSMFRDFSDDTFFTILQNSDSLEGLARLIMEIPESERTAPLFDSTPVNLKNCTTNTPACTFFNKHIGVFRRSDMHEHFPKVLRDVFDDKDLRESWHPIAVESYLDSPFGLSGLLRDEDTAETKESLKIFMGLLSAKDDVRSMFRDFSDDTFFTILQSSDSLEGLASHIEGSAQGDTATPDPEPQDTTATDCTTDTPACKLFKKYYDLFRRRDVHEHFPRVLRGLKRAEVQTELNTIIINNFANSPKAILKLDPDIDNSIVILLTVNKNFQAVFKDDDFVERGTHLIFQDPDQVDELISLVEAIPNKDLIEPSSVLDSTLINLAPCSTNTPACKLFNKYRNLFRRQDMHEHFPRVLRGLKRAEVQTELNTIIINNFANSPKAILKLDPDIDNSIVILLTVNKNFQAVFKDDDFVERGTHLIFQDPDQVDELISYIEGTATASQDTTCTTNTPACKLFNKHIEVFKRQDVQDSFPAVLSLFTTGRLKELAPTFTGISNLSPFLIVNGALGQGLSDKQRYAFIALSTADPGPFRTMLYDSEIDYGLRTIIRNPAYTNELITLINAIPEDEMIPIEPYFNPSKRNLARCTTNTPACKLFNKHIEVFKRQDVQDSFPAVLSLFTTGRLKELAPTFTGISNLSPFLIVNGALGQGLSDKQRYAFIALSTADPGPFRTMLYDSEIDYGLRTIIRNPAYTNELISYIQGTATALQDTTAPVVSISPADGVTVTDADTNIVLTFSEPIRRNSTKAPFNNNTVKNIITIQPNIRYRAELNGNKDTVTINPNDALPSGTISVSINNNYYDAAGNRGTATSVTFTVGGTAAPQSAGLPPAGSPAAVIIQKHRAIIETNPEDLLEDSYMNTKQALAIYFRAARGLYKARGAYDIVQFGHTPYQWLNIILSGAEAQNLPNWEQAKKTLLFMYGNSDAFRKWLFSDDTNRGLFSSPSLEGLAAVPIQRDLWNMYPNWEEPPANLNYMIEWLQSGRTLPAGSPAAVIIQKHRAIIETNPEDLLEDSYMNTKQALAIYFRAARGLYKARGAYDIVQFGHTPYQWLNIILSGAEAQNLPNWEQAKKTLLFMYGNSDAFRKWLFSDDTNRGLFSSPLRLRERLAPSDYRELQKLYPNWEEPPANLDYMIEWLQNN